MSETENAAVDGPTLDTDNVRVPEGVAHDEGATPSVVVEARAKLAALAAGTPSEPAVTDEPVEGTPDNPTDELTDTETQALKDLKAKYGGDLNKMAESYWESTREQSRIADEVKAMRESVEAIRNERQSAVPEFDPAPEDIPSNEDLQFVTDDIATLESEATSAKERMESLLDKADAHKAAIARAEGRAEVAEDPDQKARLLAEVERLVSKYNTEVVDKFQQAKADKSKAERELKLKQREKTTIERRIEYERQQIIKASSDNRAKLEEQGRAFNNSVEAAFKATGLPESERALYGETLTAKVSAYLRSLGNVPALSTEALVKVAEAEAAKIAKLHGLGQRTAFTAASKAKLEQNAALKSTGSSAGVGAKPPQFKSVEEEGKWHAAQARLRLAAAASRGRTAQ